MYNLQKKVIFELLLQKANRNNDLKNLRRNHGER
jgi:hypothetical protein